MGEESTTENLRFNRSLRNLPTNSAYDADGGGGGEEDDSVGGGVWLEVNRSDERSIGKEMSRVPTGYGDQGAGTPHGASISQSENRSAHTGWGSWGVVPVTRNTVNSASTKPGPKKKESKFAKVPAVSKRILHYYVHLLMIDSTNRQRIARLPSCLECPNLLRKLSLPMRRMPMSPLRSISDRVGVVLWGLEEGRTPKYDFLYRPFPFSNHQGLFQAT